MTQSRARFEEWFSCDKVLRSGTRYKSDAAQEAWIIWEAGEKSKEQRILDMLGSDEMVEWYKKYFSVDTVDAEIALTAIITRIKGE